MKAIRYKVKVSEGMMDFIHGGGREIDEIFIPIFPYKNKSICFNIERGLNVFQSDNPRNREAPSEATSIEISDSIVKRLSLLLKSIERINVTKENLLKEIKKVSIFKEATNAISAYK